MASRALESLRVSLVLSFRADLRDISMIGDRADGN